MRYENLQAGINEVMDILYLPITKLPRFRQTKRGEDYRPYYKRESDIEFVKKLYELDLETFNYSFEGGE